MDLKNILPEDGPPLSEVNKYIEKNNLPIVIRLGKRNKSLRFNKIFLRLMSSNKMIITYINHLFISITRNNPI